jgi:hypothetical protein
MKQATIFCAAVLVTLGAIVGQILVAAPGADMVILG